ncbi:MAG TPA: branched-chain amino acid ABC transporter ATP-binding protein/permease [Candidatus Dormibacteraeota bacterium]|nr:branched-chain amino acid ABC transporter ATP-binding protein/permease [Candidatus Dormibacteraeota bacterium]
MDRVRHGALGRLGLYVGLAGLLVLVIELLQPSNVTAQTLAWVAVTAIMLLGFNLIYGVTGQMVFSHSFFWGVGAYISGVLTAVYGWSFVPTIVLAVAGCAVLSFLFAGMLVGLRGFTLAIASFVLPLTLPKMLNLAQGYTGGVNGLSGIPLPVDTIQTYLIVVVVITVAALWLCQNLVRGRFGRAWRLVGQNEMMAESLGISPRRQKVIVFVLSSSIAGVSGAFFGPIFAFISPDSFDLTAMLTILVGSVVGGATVMIGAILGALLVVEVPQQLVGVGQNAALIYAFILLFVLRFFPKGIAGSVLAAAYRFGVNSASDLWGLVGRRGHGAVTDEPAPADSSYEAAFTFTPNVHSGEVLRCDSVSVRFGSLPAVQNLSLTLTPGEFKGLVGPNGAGKSTLFNVVSGFVRPVSGRVLLGDRDITDVSVSARASFGIARTFQETQVVGEFTALQSVAVGAHRQTHYGMLSAVLDLPRARRVEAEARQFASDLLSSVGISGRSSTRVRDLPYGDQKLVQVARALATRPTFLLLDEPAAGLNPNEVDRLGLLLNRVRRQGIGILLVEHNVPFVLEHCDEIIVMHHGVSIAEGSKDTILASPAVREAYLGQSHRVAEGVTA